MRTKQKGLLCNEEGCNHMAQVKGKCGRHRAKAYREEKQRKLEQAELILTKPPEPQESKVVIGAFPKPEQVTIWHTSDGREFNHEVTACRWEIDIMREKLSERSRPTSRLAESDF